jgi:exopolyphosphatase/guanosine-5'-triphosphate,3'-diphosphate pyrophosphatase
LRLSFVPSPSSDAVYAAVDLGTNNCRMLVARPGPRGFRVVDCFSRITRLGEGMAATGRLSEAAMARTIDALKICADRMVRCRVTEARIVATEACRRAANHADFSARVAAATGLVLDIITPDEEAALALAGCAALLEPAVPRALVFDIGGGSTELMWVAQGGGPPVIEGVLSLPLGVVTLAERAGESLSHAEGYDRLVGEIAAQLAPFETRHAICDSLADGTLQMLGTSGTVTTLGALHLDLDRYDRQVVDGLDLRFHDVAAVTRRLLAMDVAERAAHPCVGPERADLVLAGCAILEAICRLWPLGVLRVADRGVREGVLVTLMDGAALAMEAAP